MNRELRPGGLALVVESSEPENLGRVVETVEFLGHAAEFFYQGTRWGTYNGSAIDTWVIRPVNNHPLRDGDGDPQTELPFDALGLIPIDDPEKSERQEHLKRLVREH